MVSELDIWIRALRRRVEEGELSTLGSIDVGHGSDILPAEVAVRIMLSDLDDLEHALAPDLDEDVRRRRRQALLDEFRRLREILE